MIYLQLLRTVRCLLLAGEGRVQKVWTGVNHLNDRFFRALYPHARLMDAYPAAV